MNRDEAGAVIGDILESARGVSKTRTHETDDEDLIEFGQTVCGVLDGDTENFMSPLTVAVVPAALRDGRRVSVILKPFIYVQRRKKRSFAVLAPPQYETDFASIPSGVRWLISPFGRHAEAAVIHDWLYATGRPGSKLGRLHADQIFREAMKYLGVSFALRQIMYISVRIGGGKAFGRDDELRFRNLDTLDKEEDMIGREVWRQYTTCWHDNKTKRGPV
ncbi:MAG: DUF1353 domain-containing protein [Pseudomonadota bacterium]